MNTHKYFQMFDKIRSGDALKGTSMKSMVAEVRGSKAKAVKSSVPAELLRRGLR